MSNQRWIMTLDEKEWFYKFDPGKDLEAILPKKVL